MQIILILYFKPTKKYLKFAKFLFKLLVFSDRSVLCVRWWTYVIAKTGSVWMLFLNIIYT